MTKTKPAATPTPKPAARRSDSSANIALLQEVWRQGNNLPEGFFLPCGTEADAFTMRQALYNAVRNAKKFPHDYPTLAPAVLNCEVVYKDGDKTTLHIRRKELSPRMLKVKQLLEASGVEVEPALSGTAQSREMAASAERMLKELQEAPVIAKDGTPLSIPAAAAAPAISNPFFTRD